MGTRLFFLHFIAIAISSHQKSSIVLSSLKIDQIPTNKIGKKLEQQKNPETLVRNKAFVFCDMILLVRLVALAVTPVLCEDNPQPVILLC